MRATGPASSLLGSVALSWHYRILERGRHPGSKATKKTTETKKDRQGRQNSPQQSSGNNDKKPRNPWNIKGSGALFLFRGITVALRHQIIEFFDRLRHRGGVQVAVGAEGRLDVLVSQALAHQQDRAAQVD